MFDFNFRRDCDECDTLRCIKRVCRGAVYIRTYIPTAKDFFFFFENVVNELYIQGVIRGQTFVLDFGSIRYFKGFDFLLVTSVLMIKKKNNFLETS